MKYTPPLLRKLVAGLAITIATAGTALAFPGGGMHGGEGRMMGGGGPEGMAGPGEMRGLMRGLDLSDAQRDKIFDLMHKQQPVLREKMKELRNGREALRAMATAPTYDAQKTRALADAQAKTIADMIVMRTEAFSQMHAMLTPEQQKKLAERKPRHQP